MIRNYLKIALRTLRRHAKYTSINVLGLAVGLACVLLIGLYVRFELSYDDFHEDADRIYRVAGDLRLGDREMRVPLSPAPMGDALDQTFPEVEATTRLFPFTENTVVRHGGRRFSEDRFYYADSSFFRLFSFPLRQGDPSTALRDPNGIVVTASMAEKYFGEADPMGQTLRAADRTWQVTGVAADPPPNTHLSFDFLASMAALERSQSTSWISTNFMTYLKLRPSADVGAFNHRLAEWAKSNAAPQMKKFFGATVEQLEAGGGRYRFFLQSVPAIHLHSHLEYELEPNGNVTYVYLFSAIALFILLLACVNFMNLATARSADRAAEVGMRKALGAQRRQLAGQFFGEALLTTLVAFLVALGLARGLGPVFESLAGIPLDFGVLWNGPMLLLMAGLVLVVSLVSGSYPAFVLSSFRPGVVLKRTDRHTTGGPGSTLRKGLVVFQFGITIVLLVGTMVVYGQLEYIQQKNLGYDKERVVLIERSNALGEQQSVFKEELRKLSSVVSVGGSSGLFAGDVYVTTFVPDGQPMSASQSLRYTGVDYHFLEAMGIAVTAGRSFDPARAADSTAVLLNQRAAEVLGWEEPVDRKLRMPIPGEEDNVFTVIGVVENFHFQSLHREIQPLVLLPSSTPQYIYARFAPGTLPGGLDSVQEMWRSFAPDEPFNYTFLDQSFAALHEATQRTGRLFGIFAGLAVLIAALGLFGLATHAAQRRTKEIGIRKALGATATSIVRLLSTDFLRLVGVAFLLAVPVAYLAMQQWLQAFAYRIALTPWMFVGAGLLAGAVALVTVGTQAWRAAGTDPASVLRSE